MQDKIKKQFIEKLGDVIPLNMFPILFNFIDQNFIGKEAMRKEIENEKWNVIYGWNGTEWHAREKHNTSIDKLLELLK